MSLILEALRKSEAERRRAQAPDLFAEPQLALPRPLPTWPRWPWFALAGLGLVALLVLVRALWPPATPASNTQVRQLPASTRVPASTAGTAIATRRAATAAAASQPGAPAESLPAEPSRVKPAPLPAPPLPRPQQPGPETPAVIASAPALEQPRLPPPPVADVPAPAPAPIPMPSALPDTATMRLSDLGAEERQQLPALKLSMHMWNDTPAQRFVILDGQRLGEGDRIGNAVVELITRDGAILNWNGRRLRVSMR